MVQRILRLINDDLLSNISYSPIPFDSGLMITLTPRTISIEHGAYSKEYEYDVINWSMYHHGVYATCIDGCGCDEECSAASVEQFNCEI
jgi:hypothetical protein